jgi:predicted nucleotidyltransferase
VDFIGDFKEHTSLFDLVGLEVDLSDLLGCPVDVVTLDRLETNDAFARSVKKEMVPL